MGFSLVELMVALSVLVILLTLAVPSFSTFFEKARLRGAADDVVSLIATARGEAVKRGRDVTVSMAGSAAAWCVGANEAPTPAVAAQYGTSSACDCTSAAACFVDGVRRVVSSSDYTGVSTSSVSPAVTIDGRLGTSTSLVGTTFNLSTSNFQVSVVVSPLGQTRVCIPAGQKAISGYSSC